MSYGQARIAQADSLNDAALSRGFMVATSSMTELGQHCNTTWEAEMVMMAKERITETYGVIRYTIGMGCSGGSVGTHGVSNQYPGLLNGLLPECSFPDFWSVATVDSVDCNLLGDYFENANPSLWPNPAVRNAVYGYQNPNSYCGGRGNYAPDHWAPDVCHPSLPPDQAYNAETNPAGIRCTYQDYHVQILGRRPPEAWDRQEEQIGRGFANRFLDNVGLQYGLQALASGPITPEQFVDLNEKIRCWDIDRNLVKGRCHADLDGVKRMYRSGQIVYGTELAKVAIIDARTGDNYDVHTNLHAETTRQRLQRANGHTLNRITWYEPMDGVFGEPSPETGLHAFVTLDHWLTNVEADTSDDPLADKIVRNRPPAAFDGCVMGKSRLPDAACAESSLVYGDPRTVAGMPLTRDVLKCRLKPLDRNDYNVEFTDEQWARLQQAFPTGICDWSKPGIAQEPNTPWLTYAGGPGGQPLGEAPTSVPIGEGKASDPARPECDTNRPGDHPPHCENGEHPSRGGGSGRGRSAQGSLPTTGGGFAIAGLIVAVLASRSLHLRSDKVTR